MVQERLLSVNGVLSSIYTENQYQNRDFHAPMCDVRDPTTNLRLLEIKDAMWNDITTKLFPSMEHLISSIVIQRC